ncbi:MAG: hypothetical protein AAGE76_11460 [Pseudomonadota bacterium]
MTPQTTAALFTRADGSFHFARWGRPLAPVVFGTDDATLDTIKDAIRTVAGFGDLRLTETDPELGANLLFFFVADWQDLAQIANLDRLVPDLAPLLDRLAVHDANQYRIFRFDPGGAIRVCVIFLRMDTALGSVPTQVLATAQMAQSMLLWSDTAFRDQSPIAILNDSGAAIVRPEIAALIRAAYDPGLPAMSRDPAIAHRLAARAALLLGDLADGG